jgi:hypothetical protein
MEKLPSNIKYIVGIRTLVDTTCGTYSDQEVGNTIARSVIEKTLVARPNGKTKHFEAGTVLQQVEVTRPEEAKRWKEYWRWLHPHGYYLQYNGLMFHLWIDEFEIFIEKV